jgi:hypothetical protein
MLTSIARDLMLRTVADTVSDLINRSGDKLLSKDRFEEVIISGQVTKAEMVTWFAEELDKYFP